MNDITPAEAKAAWQSLSHTATTILLKQRYVRVPIHRPLELSPGPSTIISMPVAEFRYETGFMGENPELLERVIEMQTGVVVMRPRALAKAKEGT